MNAPRRANTPGPTSTGRHRWLEPERRLGLPGRTPRRGLGPRPSPCRSPGRPRPPASRRTWLAVAHWYRRLVTVPAGVGGAADRALHFGAVHHEARVWVNGVEVAEHVGGYTPFEADVTDAAAPTATRRSWSGSHAPADKRAIPHGKQRSIPRDDYDGVSFTPSSGIWQSVWLEAAAGDPPELSLRLRPADGLDGIAGGSSSDRLRARSADRARSAVETAAWRSSSGEPTGSHRAVAADRRAAAVVARRTRTSTTSRPSRSRPTAPTGSPATPGCAGSRWQGEHLLLNGDRLYVRGVLDQGYWPRTGLTAPDDAALRADLELAARGRLQPGAQASQAGGPALAAPRRHARHARLGRAAATGRFTPESVAAFEAQIAPDGRARRQPPGDRDLGPVQRGVGSGLGHPRRPGQAGRRRRAPTTCSSALDPTRPVVDNSGWAHVETDLVDWHYYDEYAAVLGRDGRPRCSTATQDDFPVKLGPDFVVRKKLAGSPAFAAARPAQPQQRVRRRLHQRRARPGTCAGRPRSCAGTTGSPGYVYTELYDIEHESAGLLDFDRRTKDLGGVGPGATSTPTTTLVLDLVPGAPGPRPGQRTGAGTVPGPGLASRPGSVAAACTPPGPRLRPRTRGPGTARRPRPSLSCSSSPTRSTPLPRLDQRPAAIVLVSDGDSWPALPWTSTPHRRSSSTTSPAPDCSRGRPSLDSRPTQRRFHVHRDPPGVLPLVAARPHRRGSRGHRRPTAAPRRQVLYSPNLTTYPNADASYPRAIRLDHDGSAGETMLATFARTQRIRPDTFPVFRSTDGGAHLRPPPRSARSARTPPAGISARRSSTRCRGPRTGSTRATCSPPVRRGTRATSPRRRSRCSRAPTTALTWQYLSNCTQTSGQPNTVGHGIWEPWFLLAPNNTLACFISDERPAGPPTNNQIIGHYTSTNGGATWSRQHHPGRRVPGDNLARPGMSIITTSAERRSS